MVRWQSEASEQQRAAAVPGVRSLPGNIPHIRQFVLGKNAGVDHGIGSAWPAGGNPA
jgi:hypothetical protein